MTAVRILGRQLGPGWLADGRLGYWMHDVREMVDHFASGTVPVLDGHGGEPLGYLDALMRDGRDLWFTGTVDVPASVAERLQRAGVPCSVEVAIIGRASQPRPGRYSDRPSPLAFRGQLAPGHNLEAVALTEDPSAPGSLVVALLPRRAP